MKTANMKAIIWDVDGTLYPSDEKYFAHDFDILGRIITSKGLTSYDEAIAMAKCSKEKYGYTYNIFIEKFGLSIEELDKQFHELINTDFITADPNLVSLLQKNSLINAIYSHAPHNWISSVLERRNLQKFFSPELIFSAHDYELGQKSKHKDVFIKIAETLGMHFSEIYMIDDQEKNLYIPAELGMQTVLISGQNLYSKSATPEFKGQIFASPLDFLKTI